MNFPDFAPKWFVEKHQELLGTVEFYRNSDDWDSCATGRIHDIARYEAYSEALYRILVSKDMESAWRILSTPSATAKYPKMWDYLLWNTIEAALKEFDFLYAYGKTSAQKRTSLSAIAKKTDDLRRAIASDEIAQKLSTHAIKHHLTMRNLRFRQKAGEKLIDSDYVCGLCMESSVTEAITADNDIDDKPWHKWALVSRLAYWVGEVTEMSFDDLLSAFSDLLKEEAESVSTVKQPGRGKESLKPLLIRRLNEYMIYQFNRPHDEIVAKVVTLVLDLEHPLTRDDVRPYVRSPGKK